MKLVYSNFDIYSTKLRKYRYNDNYSRYVLIKNGRDGGFEERRETFFTTDNEEVERCSISRTKRNIRELALCNSFEYFYTQTVNKSYCDRYDLKEFQNNIQKEFKAYRRKNKDFKYIIIYEKHKDGAYHLHGLVKGLNSVDLYLNDNEYTSCRFFDKIGYNSFSKIQEYNKCCNYITKYIDKDMVKNEHNQLYFCSKGLQKAKIEEFDVCMADNIPWTFENDYVKIYEEMK